ncbi:hypothetical protein G6F46_007152 [Rhizopus delemar]|uniref:Uncharacterized protein n=2 Tax=Rhizopus TaxID=4842 RepID=A0A9P6ZAF3_9FUNG|nr:hypothetical protein G6F55_006170 [Rhizopus delemar]KAG1541896.1 hypothetical protein G6F51_007610 [Rhizopus arrhizus]KAG1500073.1 hypothetical protein G6F54_003965 [Rhizopus delemar]KAG1513683.1 hypothetical protein G6F53_004251 [Rhizopus delemar]KAG1527970.1 hypothetical protein G6F52_001069 [Rhizopus delemar]
MRDFWSKRNYSFEDIPDLTGKIAIITGSNSGIGKVCALEMARKGCSVILACRDDKKAKVVVEEIKAETKNEKIDSIKLDLMSLASVKSFAEEFKSRYQELHILINNAGIMMCPFGLSKDGIETQFATNHVAHHYLTMLLLPLLEKSAPSRIVTVSSLAHRMLYREFSLKDINDPDKYNEVALYAISKISNILFTRELSKRLESKGVTKVYANCNHPGIVRTQLFRHVYSIGSIMDRIRDFFSISAEDGALTQLYLATSPEIEEKNIKGQYYVPLGAPSTPKGIAASDEHLLELWDFTENLIKEKIPDYEGAPV